MCESINNFAARENRHFLINLILLIISALFRHTGLDMVVRDDNGNILDINQTSTTQLYEHHVSATNRIRRATVSVKL
jgi:DOCK N-terminus